MHSCLWQKAGKYIAVIGIVGEFIKGASPVITGYWLGFDLNIVAIAGLASVCGQMWPIWSKFNGEKGNTVGLAMGTALSTTAMIFAIIPVIIGVLIRTYPRLHRRSNSKNNSIIGGTYSRSLPLAMMASFLILPFASLYLGQSTDVVISGFILFALIIVRRLTAGLSFDLKTNMDRKTIFFRRLFYDRSISQNSPF
jgi:glycerol-3-phosphate acyltransferase PlsY